jgi:hypothetical protein
MDRTGRVAVVLGVLVGLVSAGCHHAPERPRFVGRWSGTFFASGQQGKLRLDIGPDGKYTGSMYNQTSKANGTTSGTVSEEGKLKGMYAYPNLNVDAVGSLIIDSRGHLTGTVKGTLNGKPRGDAVIDLVKE